MRRLQDVLLIIIAMLSFLIIWHIRENINADLGSMLGIGWAAFGTFVAILWLGSRG